MINLLFEFDILNFIAYILVMTLIIAFIKCKVLARAYSLQQ